MISPFCKHGLSRSIPHFDSSDAIQAAIDASAWFMMYTNQPNEFRAIGVGGTSYYANAFTDWDSNGMMPWRNGAAETTSEGPLNWNGINGNNENMIPADLNNFALLISTDCPLAIWLVSKSGTYACKQFII